jgi:pentatricopeptide repeat protein
MEPAQALLLISSGLASVSRIADRLIRFFIAARSLAGARQVFAKAANPSIYTWHAIIAAHTELGESRRALDLYARMQEQGGMAANRFIFLCVLRACSICRDAGSGRRIVDAIVRAGMEADLALANSMLDMLSKCGSLGDAIRMFERLRSAKKTDVASWGAMMAGFAAHDLGSEALQLFESMESCGFAPNAVTFLCALRACSCIEALEEGMLLHDRANRMSLESDPAVGSALIDMYAKCGDLRGSMSVFHRLPDRDVVSWSAMISAYAERGQGEAALELYREMLAEQAIEPSKVTFLSALKACAALPTGGLPQGKLLHAQIVMMVLVQGQDEHDVALGNALVDTYAKCGGLDEARRVFDAMPHRDGISWNSIIQGYVERDLCVAALDLYRRMRKEAASAANRVTFPIVLRACSGTRSVAEGRQIHDEIVRKQLERDLAVETALVDMYAKCGAMEEARRAFDSMQSGKDVVLWGTIFGGYAQRGDWEAARRSFVDMQSQGLRPDGWIFSSILSACSHAGEVDQGRWYFASMIRDHAIRPMPDHFNCLIDLLGRAGRLEEANDIVQSLPAALDVDGWTSLLTNCKMYGHRKLGADCFHEAAHLESSCASGFVLASNLFAE